MPGESQPKVFSHHDITSVLLTHTRYQLLSFHWTSASSVVFKEYPALDLLWIPGTCPAGLVLWKVSGSSSWWASASLFTPCWGESGIGVVSVIQKAPFSYSTVRETCLKQTELSFSFGNDAFTEHPGFSHVISGKDTTGRQMMVHWPFGLCNDCGLCLSGLNRCIRMTEIFYGR